MVLNSFPRTDDTVPPPGFDTIPSSSLQKRGMDDIAQRLAVQLSEQLPGVLEKLLQAGHQPGQPLQLECILTTVGRDHRAVDDRVQVAAVDISNNLTSLSSPATTSYDDISSALPPTWSTTTTVALPPSCGQVDDHQYHERPTKRARQQQGSRSEHVVNDSTLALAQQNDHQATLVRKKRIPDNPILQPSTLEKFVQGVWESIYSGVRIDPEEVIEQWQAIEGGDQPRLLLEAENDTRDRIRSFNRMNMLARRLSQTSKTFRSLEVIVQAHWVQCFEDRVVELSTNLTREKAKKSAMAEACADFGWSEKEMRNKTAIWRGYHEIKQAAGWAALAFASTGLYRFSKYCLTKEASDKLRALRHRFELAADTLHPKWRMLLGIVGALTERKYVGHQHDWVVNAGNEAIPLAPTYYQWDANFSYKHIDSAVVDEEAWGDFDPRTVCSDTDPAAAICQSCGEKQSNDTKRNACNCYPNLYGSSKPSPVPLQIFRTPDGKNNGLLACCAVEKGWAVGEFVGEITSGLTGLDVMIGETDQCTYQIWQGRQGNHTKFVNHSCAPNAMFERFIWLGKQRIVLASLGIEPGDEVTVDYGDTYWHSLDKECKCGQPCCRYRNRRKQVEGPPQERRLLATDEGAEADDDQELSEEDD